MLGGTRANVDIVSTFVTVAAFIDRPVIIFFNEIVYVYVVARVESVVRVLVASYIDRVTSMSELKYLE